MSVPLSAQFSAEDDRNLNMFGGPRGLYGRQGSGDAQQRKLLEMYSNPPANFSGVGVNWNAVPAMYTGESGYAGLSTVTGTTIGTPEGAELGQKQLGIDPSLTGQSVGGTLF